MPSLACLKNLTVDCLKIDGSVMRDLDSDPPIQPIVAGITRVGHQVGTHAVAEFVGSAEALVLLGDMEVDHAQGLGVHVPEVQFRHMSPHCPGPVEVT